MNLIKPLEKLIALEHDAQQFGFDWTDQNMVIDQVVQECEEVRADIQAAAPPAKIQEEIGDLLHAAIDLCIFSGFDVEETLTKSCVKFENRMTALKAVAKQRGLESLQGQSMEFMLELWKEAKKITQGF